MFLGHYGLAFAAKRAAPRTSLGTLAFATQFLDELWPILLLAGVEEVRIVPGILAASPFDFVSYPWSHSLLTAALWSLLIGGAYGVVRHSARGGWIVGALVLSHWFLDAPMHRPDLPLWPGSTTLVGFGLWRSMPITLVIEFTLFLGGLAVYARSTRPRDAIGRWGLWTMAGLLVAIYLSGVIGSTPPNAQAVAVATLGLWLFVPLGWWIDRHRDAIQLAGAGAMPAAARGDESPRLAGLP